MMLSLNDKYESLVKEKRDLQKKKESEIRSMSDDDFAIAKSNIEKAFASGLMPAKIKSRRRYKE